MCKSVPQINKGFCSSPSQTLSTMTSGNGQMTGRVHIHNKVTKQMCNKTHKVEGVAGATSAVGQVSIMSCAGPKLLKVLCVYCGISPTRRRRCCRESAGVHRSATERRASPGRQSSTQKARKSLNRRKDL